jgi:hypothetical protein
MPGRAASAAPMASQHVTHAIVCYRVVRIEVREIMTTREVLGTVRIQGVQQATGRLSR